MGLAQLAPNYPRPAARAKDLGAAGSLARERGPLPSGAGGFGLARVCGALRGQNAPGRSVRLHRLLALLLTSEIANAEGE